MTRVALVRLACLTLAGLSLAGCVSSGESRNLPPAPTASVGQDQTFLYVAESSDAANGTLGGRVSKYRLALDGSLPGGPPEDAVAAVNPRRLFKHPDLPILYVAETDQIAAYDITGGTLTSLCGAGNTTLAPPCATEPEIGSDPDDMFVRNGLLYVVDRGNAQNVTFSTRIAAYTLDAAGGLPSFPTSVAHRIEASLYDGMIFAGPYVYASDTNNSVFDRYPLQPDGNLPDPGPTPTQPGTTPTPTPTPTPPNQTPTPSPTAYRAFVPGRILVAGDLPTPTPVGQAAFYVAELNRRRMGTYPIDAAYNIPENLTSESDTRGQYQSMLIDPARTHIYGSALQNGQIDAFELDDLGNIVKDTLSTTFSDPSSYPTGLAWLSTLDDSGNPRNLLYVTAGGLGRIDAYQINPDGSLPNMPVTSSEAITGSFPSDLLLYAPPTPSP